MEFLNHSNCPINQSEIFPAKLQHKFGYTIISDFIEKKFLNSSCYVFFFFTIFVDILIVIQD